MPIPEGYLKNIARGSLKMCKRGN